MSKSKFLVRWSMPSTTEPDPSLWPQRVRQAILHPPSDSLDLLLAIICESTLARVNMSVIEEEEPTIKDKEGSNDIILNYWRGENWTNRNYTDDTFIA